MELNDENLDYEDARPTPETFAIRIEMPDYMAERIAALKPAAREAPEE